MSNTEIKKFRLSDFILIGGITALALLLVFLFFAPQKSELCVSVYRENKLIYQKDLSEVKDPFEYIIHGDSDIVILVESDGVTVIKSGCRDKLCQKAGKLTSSGQSAVCMPAKVSVILENCKNQQQENEFDGITR